ncbi:MAG: glycosyltransferase, partial [Janthinobacterium lividum]
RGCLDGLLHGTDYPKLAVIVIDNGSVEPETLSYFAQLRTDSRVQILRIEGPFNYSALNNAAVRHAKGDLVGFMNNDIEVMQPGWLTEMVLQSVRPGIGAVGAKLLYANGNIQHAGVILGVYGVAAHGHRNHPADAIGYFGRPQLQQDLSAVTAAALIMPRHLFTEIGGFDATNLTVGYNDVDLCLKIREAGYRVIYTPFAELRHLESASRGMNVSPKQIERDQQERRYMAERWGMLLQHDPFYNDNLSLQNEDFQLAFPPRVNKPWLDGAEAPLWQREQRRLDRLLSLDVGRLDAISSGICVVIASKDPVLMFTRIAASLVKETCVPGHILVVDNTDRGIALTKLPGAHRLREAHPAIRVDLIRDDAQEYSISRAANAAVRAVGETEYLLVVTEDAEPAPNWFNSMLKAYARLDGEAVLAARIWLPDDRLEEAVSLRDGNVEQVVVLAEGYDGLPKPRSVSGQELTAGPVVHLDRIIVSGVFLGRSAVLCPAGTDLFDERLYATGREEDLSERLRPAGVRFASTTASLMALTRERPRDFAHLWMHVHDYSWFNRKLAGRQDSGRIEFVCPFHRGDVLIGLQVAAQAARLGVDIRMHVAAGLIEWVMDFTPGFPIEPVPVPVPPAEQTVLNLLRASLHVVQRPDAAPQIALSHPMRGLDATDHNLVSVMLEAVELPASTRLIALRPQPGPQHVQNARQRLAPYGSNVILVHRSGGWGLKTIPDGILKRIVSFLKQRGFSVVQIGGPGDDQISYLDGAITEGLSPLQWAAIFQQARAVVGVDSWSAHFASILDIPQITLYGSTSPLHVNSKAFFVDQKSPSLVLGPVVDCSPCNSLTCLRAPIDYCLGYTFDAEAVGAFLDNLSVYEEGFS